jgi:hypothetical protein
MASPFDEKPFLMARLPNQSPYDARFASSGSTGGHEADDAKKTITPYDLRI